MYLAAYWVYALRYYRWLGDTEQVLYEAPLVLVSAPAAVAGQCEPPASVASISTDNIELQPVRGPGQRGNTSMN